MVLTGSDITITDTATSDSWTYTDADLGGGSFSNFGTVYANGSGDLSGSGTNALYYGGAGGDTMTGTANADHLESYGATILWSAAAAATICTAAPATTASMAAAATTGSIQATAPI